MLSTLYLLFLATLVASPASFGGMPQSGQGAGQAVPPKVVPMRVQKGVPRVVIVRFLVRLEPAEKEALTRSIKSFADLEPSLSRIVPRIDNRFGKRSSKLRKLRNWDIALCLPSEELEGFANAGLLAALPEQKSWLPLWVIPYGGLGVLASSAWPKIMRVRPGNTLLPDIVVEPGFLRILAVLHREFRSEAVAQLSDGRKRLDLLNSNHIRTRLAKDLTLGGVCALTAEEAKGRQGLPALRLAAGISAAAKEQALLVRLLVYLCAPEQRQSWILRTTGLPAEEAAALDLLPDVSETELERVSKLWNKQPVQSEPDEEYPLLNTLLLFVFGGLFVLLLFSSVRRGV